MKKGRYTVGFLDENSYDEYHSYMTGGIYDAAHKYGMNIVRFGHFASHITSINDVHTDMFLKLIGQFNLDGLIFLGWSRAVSFNLSVLRERFPSIPLLSVGTGFPEIPSVYFPGDIYLREMIDHLVKVHHFGRIAYIAPFLPDDRSRVYVDAMKDYGIYSPELYVGEKDLEGLEVPLRGKKAVSILLDERAATFDAIISLYNDETKGLIEELKARGVDVPGDIAVTSYEDGEIGRFLSPSLTTIYFPWREIGFAGGEKMYELLSAGKTQESTMVPGRVIIRESCGCIPGIVTAAGSGNIRPSDICFEEIGAEEFGELSLSIEKEAGGGVMWFENLMLAFRNNYRDRSGGHFLRELGKQLRDTVRVNTQLTLAITAFRNVLLPYFVHDSDSLMWAENLFHQAQVLLQEKISGVWAQEEINSRRMYLTLKEISQILTTNFTVKTLMDSLELNLPKLDIRGCRIVTFGDYEKGEGLPQECTLEFEYANGIRVKHGPVGKVKLADILSKAPEGKDGSYLLSVHLLYTGNDFTGFVMFEPGVMDMRVYQNLAVNISTALSGAILLEKLDRSYRRLVEQAHRGGMADVSTGILHNIANILNSVGVTTQRIKEMADSSSISDLLFANQLLEKNMDDLERFIIHDQRGPKLMRYYIRIGDSILDLREQLTGNISRLSEKIGMIDDIIKAQQNYIGVRSTLEELDAAEIIEDSIKINAALIEKSKVEIVRNYSGPYIIMGQKTKLFHVLTNLVKNAVESMDEMPAGKRMLTISTEASAEGRLVKITDTGHGIALENLEGIFAYGFTTKKSGHGFGLHSCANYVTEMEGKLWAESEGPGSGATFILQLKKSANRSYITKRSFLP